MGLTNVQLIAYLSGFALVPVTYYIYELEEGIE